MKKLILPAIALLLAVAACHKEPGISIPDKNFQIGESAEGQSIGVLRDSTITIVFPSTFKKEQYTNMELSIDSGDKDSWNIRVTAPTFDYSGEYLGTACVTVRPGDSGVFSSIVLKATVYWADGSSTEAVRTVFRDETYETTPGFYRVGGNDYAYVRGKCQTAVRRYATTVTFAMSDPEADTYFLCTGLSDSLTEGKEASFTLMQNWTGDLPASSVVKATVLRVQGGLIWLRDENKVKYILKY